MPAAVSGPPRRSVSSAGEAKARSIGNCWSSSMPMSRASGLALRTASASTSWARVSSGTGSASQILLEHGEPEVVVARHPDALLAVRKGPGLAGAHVAAPLVPGDELGPPVDHAHLQGAGAALAGGLLRGVEQRRSDAAALPVRADREHAERRGGGA